MEGKWVVGAGWDGDQHALKYWALATSTQAEQTAGAGQACCSWNRAPPLTPQSCSRQSGRRSPWWCSCGQEGQRRRGAERQGKATPPCWKQCVMPCRAAPHRHVRAGATRGPGRLRWWRAARTRAVRQVPRAQPTIGRRRLPGWPGPGRAAPGWRSAGTCRGEKMRFQVSLLGHAC